MSETVKAVLPYLVMFAALMLFARRLKRPRQLRPRSLWIFPVIFIASSGWYAWMACLYGPHLTFYDELTIVAAALGGVVSEVAPRSASYL